MATTGDFRQLVAALLWGFSEIGQRLAQGRRPAAERCAKWIEMYAAGEFAELAQSCRDLLDRLAEGLPERDLRRLEEAFITSSRYEWQIWETKGQANGRSQPWVQVARPKGRSIHRFWARTSSPFFVFE